MPVSLPCNHECSSIFRPHLTCDNKRHNKRQTQSCRLIEFPTSAPGSTPDSLPSRASAESQSTSIFCKLVSTTAKSAPSKAAAEGNQQPFQRPSCHVPWTRVQYHPLPQHSLGHLHVFNIPIGVLHLPRGTKISVHSRIEPHAPESCPLHCASAHPVISPLVNFQHAHHAPAVPPMPLEIPLNVRSDEIHRHDAERLTHGIEATDH